MSRGSTRRSLPFQAGHSRNPRVRVPSAPPSIAEIRRRPFFPLPRVSLPSCVRRRSEDPLAAPIRGSPRRSARAAGLAGPPTSSPGPPAWTDTSSLLSPRRRSSTRLMRRPGIFASSSSGREVLCRTERRSPPSAIGSCHATERIGIPGDEGRDPQVPPPAPAETGRRARRRGARRGVPARVGPDLPLRPPACRLLARRSRAGAADRRRCDRAARMSCSLSLQPSWVAGAAKPRRGRVLTRRNGDGARTPRSGPTPGGRGGGAPRPGPRRARAARGWTCARRSRSR